ncbi:vWA domain-containing protein [Pseudonocardia sp. GCM10023141]|uniref:vWA domain-containing protein n=1 Tax=Pseudonocardia sp. GCM10023141 TaxID=3252653 RepID=UPI003618632F
MAEPGRADLPALVARFAAACADAGLPVGPDRAARFTQAVLEVAPSTTTRLRHCATATLVSGPDQMPILAAVFAAVFEGLVGPPGQDLHGPALAESALPNGSGSRSVSGSTGFAEQARTTQTGGSTPDTGRESAQPTLGSARERFGRRDFAELTAAELAQLADAMRAMRIATPLRRSRRTRPTVHSGRVDLRATLRAARDTGGDPLRLAHRTARRVRRRLVVLCDISASMEPYARALIQLLYCAAGARRAEVFTFATQLTRLTRALARVPPTAAFDRAAALAPDWSGGTRIGESLRHFNDSYGRRGMARGAVILVLSDGWDTGDPAVLGREMTRLSRVAHRIVWANPRTRHPDYSPRVGGMAAAWPYCDAVVSAHSLTSLDDLLSALAAPAAR